MPDARSIWQTYQLGVFRNAPNTFKRYFVVQGRAEMLFNSVWSPRRVAR
jgi:hypothetical protein